ncbi:MAG: DUF1559 domain-containing protein [Planctomycetaceae bacterium]|jgi:hypothetical protein|nr:DUF1559 domain-containing protein [Planctomycetaceae bacterium]
MLKRLFGVWFVSVCFLGTSGLLSAQETFAPLITDDCVAMLHVDLRKADFDKIKLSVVKSLAEHLKELQFDNKSYNATMREFGKVMGEMDKIVRPKFRLVADELGIKEFAMIINIDSSESKLPVGFFAFPWKNKTDEDLKTFEELLSQLDRNINGFMVKGDFLIYHSIVPDEIIDRIKKLSPSKDAKIFAALKEAGNSEVKIAFAVNDQIRKRIIEVDDQTIPQQAKGILLFAANKVEWISVSLSLGQLISDEKKLSGKAVIKVPRKEDAVFLRSLLESCIDNGIFFAKTALAVQAKNDPQVQQFQQFIPFVSEYSAGLLRSLLPKVSNDRLIFSIELEGNNANHSTAVVGVGLALLLPAVQSAREAASQMQDLNKIKMIILAFHNYYDANNKLPPLYTVDKNGKPLHSWRVLLLPFIEQTALYNSIKLDEPWDSEHNKHFHNIIPLCYKSQFSDRLQTDKNCSFAVIEGQPLKPKDGAAFGDITDGTSNTFSVVIRRDSFCWMDPLANVKLSDLEKGLNKPDSAIGFGTKRPTPFGFWDGSVRQIPNDTDPDLLKKAGTANGGEVVNLP